MQLLIQLFLDLLELIQKETLFLGSLRVLIKIRHLQASLIGIALKVSSSCLTGTELLHLLQICGKCRIVSDEYIVRLLQLVDSLFQLLFVFALCLSRTLPVLEITLSFH